MDNKRIVFIGFDIEGTGGISTYSRYQVKALREDFKNVQVVTLDKFDKKYSGFSDITIKYTNKILLIKLLLTLLKDIKNIDLIIFNHVNLSFLGAILKKIYGCKYIIFGYNTDVLINLKGLYEFGFKNADVLGIDCQYTINRLKEFHKIIPKTYLLYDPIDINFFKPYDKEEAKGIISKKYNINLENKFIITTVALMRETANKGHRLIIDAIEKLNNTDIIYFITSGGEDKNNIEQYVKDKGLQSQVIFFGFVENELIPYFYNASDVVALISKNEYGKGEGVPLGLIEASACEVPILAGNEDGSYEAISDKYPNGFRVSPRNIDEIASKIQYYMDNPEIKKEHGKNGRKFVIEEFEYSKFREKQYKIIKEVLDD